jgi:CRISPR system Cascade subunit CasD
MRLQENLRCWPRRMVILTIRLTAPLMALQGPRIDGEPQSLPIPTRSLLTGLIGSALGYTRGDHAKLQALQDNMRVGVVVHRSGVEVNDYQIADLGKPYMRGPMWSSGTSVAKREGSQIEGLRPQRRPYRADADMTAIVELRAGCPSNAEEIIAALEKPAHPLFIGRSSCPPASKLAGRIFDAPSLEAVVLEVARDHPGEIYLPAEVATPAWGDLPLSIPGCRDWTTYRHAGTDLYVMRPSPSSPAQP